MGGRTSTTLTPERAAELAAGRAERARQEAERNKSPHPLFPVREGQTVREIAWIGLSRREPGQGWVSVPTIFRAEDFQNGQEDLIAMFGGGSYEIRGHARSPTGTHGMIVDTRFLTLPGESIPISGKQQSDAVAARALADREAKPTSGLDPFVMMMFEGMRADRAAAEQRERDAKEREERRADEDRRRQDEQRREDARRAEENQKFMLSMLTNRPDPVQQFAGMAQAMAALQPKPSEGLSGVGALREVLGLAKELAPAAPAQTESIGDVLAGAAAILPALAAMSPGNGGGQGGAPIAANPLLGVRPAAPPAPEQPAPAQQAAPAANGAAHQGEAGALRS
jgi:hypothetical protein